MQAAAVVLAAYSAYSSKTAERDQLNTQALFEDQEAGIARAQANVAEGDVRHSTREALGRQIGAFGAAGVAGGASTYGAERESSINQELDALRTRYKGAIVAYGYNTQGYLDRMGARAAQKQAAISAAGALLKGMSGSYTGGGEGIYGASAGQYSSQDLGSIGGTAALA